MTFGEMSRRVREGARFFREAGMRAGERVVLLHPVSVDFYVYLLSAFEAGLTVVVFDPSRGGGLCASAWGG